MNSDESSTTPAPQPPAFDPVPAKAQAGPAKKPPAKKAAVSKAGEAVKKAPGKKAAAGQNAAPVSPADPDKKAPAKKAPAKKAPAKKAAALASDPNPPGGGAPTHPEAGEGKADRAAQGPALDSGKSWDEDALYDTSRPDHTSDDMARQLLAGAAFAAGLAVGVLIMVPKILLRRGRGK